MPSIIVIALVSTVLVAWLMISVTALAIVVPVIFFSVRLISVVFVFVWPVVVQVMMLS